METRDIEYQADGMRAVGYLALPDGTEPRPGVLVCHEGPGLDDHARGRARRLAEELGYVAFALDYIGDGQRLTDMQDVMARLGPLMGDPVKTRALGQAGLDQLLGQDRVDPSRVAAIGYCFGGTMALELARSGADLRAVVGFHSGLATSRPAEAGSIRGKVLACIGAEDPMVPAEQRLAFEQEMQAAGADWQLIVLGGAVHSFTNPQASALGAPGVAYHEPSDNRSWAAMVDLFAEALA